MEIAKEEDVTRVQRSLHHLLNVVVHWEFVCVSLRPLPVQVSAEERTPIVTDYYAVRVLHRHNFKNEFLPQEFRLLII
jgi:hypothetical protein